MEQSQCSLIITDQKQSVNHRPSWRQDFGAVGLQFNFEPMNLSRKKDMSYSGCMESIGARVEYYPLDAFDDLF